jgi:hypothetical protein
MPAPRTVSCWKAVRAFEVYVTHNRAFIPDYGERYRGGKIISTASVDSTVNQVGEQALCEKAADAVDRSRRPPAVANPSPSTKRGVALDPLALVPRNGDGSREQGRVASG